MLRSCLSQTHLYFTMAVFDVAQNVVNASAGIISGDTAIDASALEAMEDTLMGMDLGPLIGLFLQSFIVQATMSALAIVIFIIVYGRMIEIYLLVSLAPIPFSTFANREQSSVGQNYLRALLAIGFQGFLIEPDASEYMRCWCSQLHFLMTLSHQSGVLWDIPFFCVSHYLRHQHLQRQCFQLIKEVGMKKYGVIYADPPWAYRVWSQKGNGRSAESHYSTMSLDKIKTLPVGELADKDCALFMWITFPLLKEAWNVVEAWGFTYKSVAFVWVKQNKKTPSLFWGMGYWTRANAGSVHYCHEGQSETAVQSRPSNHYVPD